LGGGRRHEAIGNSKREEEGRSQREDQLGGEGGETKDVGRGREIFLVFGSHRKKLVKNCLIAASCEAGVYRIVATGIIIKGWHQTRYQPHAVWHRHSDLVALVRCPIPRDGGSIIPYLPEAIKR
jgi:hypothetical protein